VVATAVSAALLVPVTLSLVPLGLAGPAYGVAAAVLGGGLAGYALAGLRAPVPVRWARSFFLTTLVYLTLLLAALFVWAR
jgi:heme o synthase